MINNKIYLYLDDVRTPLDPSWQVVRNYDEFVSHIRMWGLENYAVISLDHDLGEEAMVEYYRNVKRNNKLDYTNIQEKTGLDCAKFLVDESFRTGINLPVIYVHSANPVGSENIMNIINSYLKSKELTEKCVRVKVEHTYMDSLSEEDKNRRLEIMKNFNYENE